METKSSETPPPPPTPDTRQKTVAGDEWSRLEEVGGGGRKGRMRRWCGNGGRGGGRRRGLGDSSARVDVRKAREMEAIERSRCEDEGENCRTAAELSLVTPHRLRLLLSPPHVLRRHVDVFVRL